MSSHPASAEPRQEACEDSDRRSAANALLQLLSPDAHTPQPVTAQQLPGGAGVGLVARCDVAPGTPLLVVPLSLVLETADDGNEVLQCAPSGQGLLSQSNDAVGDQQLPWSARMARMLLDAVGPPAHAASAASRGSDAVRPDGPAGPSQVSGAPEAAASGGGDPGGSQGAHHSRQAQAWRHWGDALPDHVPVAFAHASEAELQGVGEEGLAAEALAVRLLMLDSHQAAAGQHSLAAWRWAWSCVHSRSFKEGDGRHLVVPGVDLANHSFAPSAHVRMARDPDRCQGYAAMSDVCEPEALPAGEARVELRAGDAGLREGEEVTISYGPWPDDVFALFYGFLPRQQPAGQAQQLDSDAEGAQQSAEQHLLASSNPHDKFTLFADLQQVADFTVAQFGPADAEVEQQDLWAAAVTEDLVAALGGNYMRLFMTPVGFDERLAMAAQQVLQTSVLPLGWPADARDDGAPQPLQPSDLLAARIAQMRMAADASLQPAADDMAPHGSGGGSGTTEEQRQRPPEHMSAMLRCAVERRALLDGALRALWGPSAAPLT